MKKALSLFTGIVFSLILSGSINAQTTNEAYAYLGTIGKEYQSISEDYLKYVSSIAHNNARKAEKRRTDLLRTIAQAKSGIASMQCYNNDCSLRDSVISYLTISYYVLNNDYQKIVNMEEISEQSYDLMEAYWMAKNIAENKVEEASSRLDKVEKEFEIKNNLQVPEDKSVLSKKIEQANLVNMHYQQVYLIFFKSYKQEAYLLEAMERKDLNSAEQNKNALLQTANEGLATLDTLKAFRNDKSIMTACRKMLEFYKTESTSKMPIIIDFIMKSENFNKMKEAFDAKEPMTRTQSEVDNYNKAVNEINTLSRNYNSGVNYINQNRNTCINNWQTQVDSYLKRYVPKYD